MQVAEAEGFSAAARRLGLSTSFVSRSVARLEDRLGTQLLNRTTRRILLTDAGRALLERASQPLMQLAEAEAVVAEQTGELGGTLKITVPVNFGTRYLAGILARFAVQHHGVELDLSFDDRRVDLLAEGFDLAVRIGHLRDSSFLARRVGHTRRLTLASRAYLAERGTPRHPRDLAEHEVLLYSYQSTGPVWRFTSADGELAVRVTGRFVSNNAEGILAAAVAGMGITRLPDAVAADRVRDGSLVRILAPWENSLPVSAIYPNARHSSPKVRALVEFLVQELAPAPWLVATEGLDETEVDGRSATA